MVDVSLVLHLSELTNGGHPLFLVFPYCFRGTDLLSMFCKCRTNAKHALSKPPCFRGLRRASRSPFASSREIVPLWNTVDTAVRTVGYPGFPDQETRGIWPRLQTGKHRSLPRGGRGRTATLAAFCLTYRCREPALPVRVPRGSASHAPSRHCSR